jgi:hypothetical protein
MRERFPTALVRRSAWVHRHLLLALLPTHRPTTWHPDRVNVLNLLFRVHDTRGFGDLMAYPISMDQAIAAIEGILGSAPPYNFSPLLTLGAAQSASFTLAANTLYPCVATNAITGTLPVNPTVGQLGGIYTGNFAVMLAAGAGGTINGQASVNIGATGAQGQWTIIVMAMSSTTWNVVGLIGTDAGLCLRVGGALLVTGAATLGGTTATQFGISAAAPSVAETVATVLPTSATIQTALGNLALGTALHNTLSYDVWLTVYLAVTANTSLVVTDGACGRPASRRRPPSSRGRQRPALSG